MSKKVKEKVCELPNPLTVEGLARFNKEHLLSCTAPWQKDVIAIFEKAHEARNIVLVSREMEITLSSHIYIDKDYSLCLDKFFIENYPDTFKNAMKLAFRYYLDYPQKSERKHPHFSELLELIAKKEEWREFYGCCMELTGKYNRLERQVRETWGKIKDEVNFEKAIMAVNILYVKDCLPYFNNMYGNNLIYQQSFLNAANTYLTETIEYWRKSIDRNLWENESKMMQEISYCFASLLKRDYGLLVKIYTHIQAIMEWQGYRYSFCESFIFDKTFNPKFFTHDGEDDKICALKNFVLPKYYHAIGFELIEFYLEQSKKNAPNLSERTHNNNAYSYCVIIPLLMYYFGIEEQFLYNNKTYDLFQLIIDKGGLSNCYRNYHLKELQNFFMDYPNAPFEDGLIVFVTQAFEIRQKRRFPVEIRHFSELADLGKADNFRLLSTDISKEKSELPIDLKLYNTFHYGQSDLCVVFPYIRATTESGYLELVNLLRKNKNSKKEADRIENFVARQFNDCPVFSGIKPTVGKRFECSGEEGEIDVAVYKDKTLILIEVKSTYGVITFKERFQHEKCLIYAGHQLNKAVEALKTNTELLAEVTGDKNINFDELRIETLIVSTSFEFDNQRFSGHRKISLLDLMVCLHNDAIHLIMTSPVLQPPEVRELCERYENNPNKYDLNEIYSRLEHIVAKFDLRKMGKEFSLYGNIKKPTMDDFLKALNSNFWEKVLPYWQEKL